MKFIGVGEKLTGVHTRTSELFTRLCLQINFCRHSQIQLDDKMRSFSGQYINAKGE